MCNEITYSKFYIIPFIISMKTTADFSDAVPTSAPAVTSRVRVPDSTANDSLASDITLVYNAQQIFKSGRRSLESNVTRDERNSLSKPRNIQNSEAVQRSSNPHRLKEHIDITTQKSPGSYGTVPLSNSSEDVNNEESLRNKYIDKVVSFNQEGQNEHYSGISKGMQVKNVNDDVYRYAGHETLNSSIVSERDVKHEKLGDGANEMKHTTASNDTKGRIRPEARSFRYGTNFKPNDDDFSRETELTYTAGDGVPFDHEEQMQETSQDGELVMLPSNYKKGGEPFISSSGTVRVLHSPFPPLGSPYGSHGNRHTWPRPSHAPPDVDLHGSPSSYYGLSSGSPYKSSSLSYILKPRDSFGLESASYSSIVSVPHRPPTVIYDSPPRELLFASHGSLSRKPSSAPHGSPSRKPSSVSYASPPRKPPIVSYESPPYKQFSQSYNSPSLDLHESSSTLHYSPRSPSFVSVPHKISRPSYAAQASDSYGSHTSPHGSFQYGSKPLSSPSHGPPRHSYSSPLKKSPGLSYNLQTSDLHESLTSHYTSSSHASRPPILGNSPSHKSHRSSHGPPQKPPTHPQFSESYKPPASPHSSSRVTKPSISYSSAYGSHKSPQKSPRPAYESQPSEQYESLTSIHGLTIQDTKSPTMSDSSLSNTQHGPSRNTPSKKSHRPSYDSESTDSVESPSSSYSSPSHGLWSSSLSEISPTQRLSKPLHGSSHRSINPSHDSPSSALTRTSHGLPSNLIYEASSDTFQESLGSSEGGTGDSTHTFVKTDHHGNVKWGVRHSVGNQNASSPL
jgi:hypothetical protein